MLTSLSQQPSQGWSCHHSTLGAMMMMIMRSSPRKGDRHCWNLCSLVIASTVHCLWWWFTFHGWLPFLQLRRHIGDWSFDTRHLFKGNLPVSKVQSGDVYYKQVLNQAITMFFVCAYVNLWSDFLWTYLTTKGCDVFGLKLMFEVANDHIGCFLHWILCSERRHHEERFPR